MTYGNRDRSATVIININQAFFLYFKTSIIVNTCCLLCLSCLIMFSFHHVFSHPSVLIPSPLSSSPACWCPPLFSSDPAFHPFPFPTLPLPLSFCSLIHYFLSIFSFILCLFFSFVPPLFALLSPRLSSHPPFGYSAPFLPFLSSLPSTLSSSSSSLRSSSSPLQVCWPSNRQTKLKMLSLLLLLNRVTLFGFYIFFPIDSFFFIPPFISPSLPPSLPSFPMQSGWVQCWEPASSADRWSTY